MAVSNEQPQARPGTYIQPQPVGVSSQGWISLRLSGKEVCNSIPSNGLRLVQLDQHRCLLNLSDGWGLAGGSSPREEAPVWRELPGASPGLALAGVPCLSTLGCMPFPGYSADGRGRQTGAEEAWGLQRFFIPASQRQRPGALQGCVLITPSLWVRIPAPRGMWLRHVLNQA